MAHIKRMTDKPRKLPWRAQVKRKGHPTMVKMFLTREQAQRWANAQESSILEAGLPLTIKQLEKHTVGDIVRRYLDEITPRKGCSVSETAVLKALLRRDIARKSLAYVKKADAYTYLDERLRETWNGRNIAPSTVRRECNSIQHVFEVAREQWEFENLANPFRGIRIRGSLRRRKRRLEEGELEKLDKACERCRGLNHYYVPLAIYLAIETGMRLQEIFNLTWRDVDFERHQIEIRKSKTDHLNPYSGRTIVLSINAEFFLSTLNLDLRNENRWKKDDRIFPMTRHAFKQAWSDAVDRAEINDLTFHDLRREAGSRFDEAGLTRAEHDLMMGHSNRDMTSLYISSNLKIIREKLERYALRGETVKEVIRRLGREGISEQEVVSFRAFVGAAQRGLSLEQVQASAARAVRVWKSQHPDHANRKIRLTKNYTAMLEEISQ